MSIFWANGLLPAEHIAQKIGPDGKAAMQEALTSIKRAGADMILTYYAKEFARQNADRPNI